MRYLKQLVDAVNANMLVTAEGRDGQPPAVREAISQATAFLTRVKSLEYQGSVTIRFNGDIHMETIKSDLDDVMLLLADKKANESFIAEIYVIIHTMPASVPAIVAPTMPVEVPAAAILSMVG